MQKNEWNEKIEKDFFCFCIDDITEGEIWKNERQIWETI